MTGERRERDPETERRIEHSRLRAEYIITHYIKNNSDKPLAKAFAQGKFTLEESYELLEEFARDPKTGVLRYDFMPYAMEYEAQYAREHEGEKLTIGLVDIDDFKTINDELLYQDADEVLPKVATIIAHEIRRSDESIEVINDTAQQEEQPATDDVIRFGGEEFVVLFSSTTLAQARVATERIRKRIQDELQVVRPNGQPITVSIGLSSYDTTEREEWGATLMRANAALRDAKKEGKNRVYPVPETRLVA